MAVDKYSDDIKRLTMQHRVIERIGHTHKTSPTKAEVKCKCDQIDLEVKKYTKGAERHCQRIKSGRIPFSTDSSKWIR